VKPSEFLIDMIRSFADKDMEKLLGDIPVAKFKNIE
jgi:hypothetical protein